jgi:hypothetical protein
VHQIESNLFDRQEHALTNFESQAAQSPKLYWGIVRARMAVNYTSRFLTPLRKGGIRHVCPPPMGAFPSGIPLQVSPLPSQGNTLAQSIDRTHRKLTRVAKRIAFATGGSRRLG